MVLHSEKGGEEKRRRENLEAPAAESV